MAACSSMQIQTAKDPQANLAKYQTYAWASNPAPSLGGPHYTILDQTIRSTVEKDLAAKGLLPAQGSPPDLLINYYGVARNEVTYGAMSPAYGYWGWGQYDRAYVTREGSLTLQFTDPKTNRIVWQGTAAETIGEAGASQKQVANAVDELIKKYPTA